MNECDVTFDEEARTIFFSDDVTSTSALSLMSLMSALYSADNDAPILLAIDSSGGDCYEAVGIRDFMKFLPVEINTICFGHAFSSGFYLFMAGDHRYATPNATLMYHSVTLGIADNSIRPAVVSQEVMESNTLQDIMDKQIIENARAGIEAKMKQVKETGSNWYIRQNEMKKYRLCKIIGETGCQKLVKKKSKSKD